MTSSSRPFQHSYEQYPSWTSSHGVAPSDESATSQALVATGKKRKRLQRACVACHKAKRRCDGGLPCSNCDFSGRLCSYSDSQGKMVPPTKRSLKPSEAAMQEQKQQKEQRQTPSHALHQQSHSHSVPLSHSHHQGMSVYTSSYQQGSPTSGPSTSTSPVMGRNNSPRHEQETQSSIEPSLETRRELLLIFFSHLAPMSSVFDEISFLRDLSSMEVSRFLLYAMYAVSASYAYDAHRKQQHQHSTSPASHTKYSKLVAEAGNGTLYVMEARRLLYHEDKRSGQSMIDGSPNMEVAQSLYLLAFLEFNQGRYFRASSYIQLSSKHVTCLSLPTDHIRHSRDSAEDSSTRVLEKRNLKRLACLITAMDVSIGMMNGQSMSTKQWDVEAAIDTCSGLRGDEDEETLAMMQLLNVSFVLNTALELLQKSKTYAADVEKQAVQCEGDLHRWAERLPRQLHFDEKCLRTVEQVLNERADRPRSPNSSLQMSKSSAVCWILMHTMAETTTLLLKELTDRTDRASKLAACRNFVILLEQSDLSSLPRLFASLSVAVLYTVSSTVTDRNDDREWARLRDRAGSFAAYIGLEDSVWTSMAHWWRRRRDHVGGQSMSPQSGSHRGSLTSPTSSISGHRLPLVSSPSLQSNATTSSHRSSLPSPTNNYLYLPPLAGLASSAPTLPPLRLNSSEKPSKHFWDQPQRPMTVNLS